MRFELFFIKKLHLYRTGKSAESSAFTLKIATFGIALAIIIMIASIAIVSGFKSTIINKISQLEPHIELRTGEYQATNASADSISLSPELIQAINSQTGGIKSASLVAESPCIVKTKDDFNGMVLKGVTEKFDSTFLSGCITDGTYNVSGNNIIISKHIADKIKISTGNKISVFFIKDGKIKQRRLTVAGIYNTDFEDFDKAIIIGDIKIVQSVNSWNNDTGTSIDIFCNDINEAGTVRENIASSLLKSLYAQNSDKVYQLSTIVSCFSLIAGLLIVVLNRINMIGILKSLGADNRCIRTIFIYLAEKIILRAMVIGNAAGLLLIMLQKHFHIIGLDASTYYMSYVPVEINIWLLVLNIGILIVSTAALIGPSYIIASITPAKTIKFE